MTPLEWFVMGVVAGVAFVTAMDAAHHHRRRP